MRSTRTLPFVPLALLLVVALMGPHAYGDPEAIVLRPGLADTDAILLADWRGLRDMTVHLPASVTNPPRAEHWQEQDAIGTFEGPFSLAEVDQQIAESDKRLARFGGAEFTRQWAGAKKRREHWIAIKEAVGRELDTRMHGRFKSGDPVYTSNGIKSRQTLEAELDRIGERAGMTRKQLESVGDEYRRAVEVTAGRITGTWRSAHPEGNGVYRVQVTGTWITWTGSGTYGGKPYTHRAEGTVDGRTFKAVRRDIAGHWVHLHTEKPCSGVVSQDGRTIEMQGMNKVESTWKRIR